MAKKLKFETYIKIQYYNKTERDNKTNNTEQHTTQNNTKQHKTTQTTQNNTKQHKTMAMSPSKIDFSKISISAPKTMDNGGKMLYINYGGGINSLYVTTPEVEIPFDPSYFADNENSGKFSVKFSMKDLDGNKSMKDFHTWAVKMDEMLLTKASENSQAWFRKAKLSDETLKELYTPMVKVSTDPETGEPNGKYPDSFAFKINKRDGKFKDSQFTMEARLYLMSMVIQTIQLTLQRL